MSQLEKFHASSRRDTAGGLDRSLTSNPDLVEALEGLLHSGRATSQEFERELATLVAQHQEVVYSELIYLLCQLRFEPGEAGSHWRNIVELRRSMERRMDAPVDFRVALVRYFLEVGSLDNPTVIEMMLLEQAREMAYRDELTGLYNFRYFNEALSYEISRSDQYHSGLSLVLIDIDDFKSYNDNLGHQAGNEALASIATLITELLRQVDVVARYGGEEFAVVAPETPKAGALLIAERISARIEAHVFPGEEGQPGGRLTVSLGVAAYPADASSAEELVRCGDQALYRAKSRGKNQVCLYGNDRRTYRRVPVSIEGALWYGAAEASLTTVEMSEGGVRLWTDLSLPAEALVELRLQLSGSEIRLVGRVVKSSAREAGGWDVALRIIEIGTRDHMRLAAALKEIEHPAPDSAYEASAWSSPPPSSGPQSTRS